MENKKKVSTLKKKLLCPDKDNQPEHVLVIRLHCVGIIGTVRHTQTQGIRYHVC